MAVPRSHRLSGGAHRSASRSSGDRAGGIERPKLDGSPDGAGTSVLGVYEVLGGTREEDDGGAYLAVRLRRFVRW